MCEPRPARVRIESRGAALMVVAAFGAAGALQAMAAVAGWASLVMPALGTALILGPLVFGAVAAHRAGVARERARRRTRTASAVRVTARSVAVDRVQVWPSDRLAIEQPRIGAPVAPRPALPPGRPVLDFEAAWSHLEAAAQRQEAADRRRETRP